MVFTDAEIEYLKSQRIGRLCTLGPSGAPQAKAVGVHLGPGDTTIDVYGFDLSESQKWRNVLRDPRVSFIVDDLVSVQPWVARGIEIRGEADALEGAIPPKGKESSDVIRIRPRRILSWGINEDGRSARTVP